METYFSDLLSSSLSLPFWALMVVWLALFICGHLFARTNNILFSKQKHIVTGDTDNLVKALTWKLMLFQILFSAGIFTFAKCAGGPVYVFFAGGWTVVALVSIPLNLMNLLFLQALAQPGAASGSVNFSGHLAVKDAAFKLIGMAAFCLILGLLMAHLALLGGAFFMFATGIGYLRKSLKKAKAQPT